MRRSTLGWVGFGALAAALWIGLTPTDAPRGEGKAEPAQVSSWSAAARDVARGGGAAVSSSEDTADTPKRRATYLANERLVRFVDGADATAAVARHGATLLRPPGHSGFALVSGSATALDGLARDAEVGTALPHATTMGARNIRNRARPLESYQWYIDQIDPVLPGRNHNRDREAFDLVHPFSDFVVAVLDTGIAYDEGRRPLGLTSSAIVAPWDFVNADAEAFDDHQHGTHIASLIAADGVHGAIEGIAPGVGLMPVKVLDHNNMGVEIDLVEGIHHAVANGADVINLSLSFGEGYRPSLALLEALNAAHEAGIVMVGAAGNDGADYITWPAASPLVLAVGASALHAKPSRYEDRGPAGYTNLAAGMDVMTSGGDLSRSGEVEGLPNGMLAETIALDDPDRVGHWLMAGTSQAAGVVSGLVVGLLTADVAPDRVPAALQAHAETGSAGWHTVQMGGEGAGYLDMDWGGQLDPFELYSSLPADGQRYERIPDYHVALLPFLEDLGTGDVRASARVTVFEEDGTRAENTWVLASLYGADQGIVSCLTDAMGTCTLQGSALPEADELGQPLSYAVAFSVEKVIYGDYTRHAHPRVAMTATPELEALVGALCDDEQASNALLAWSFGRIADPDLGALAPSLSVVDSGSGLASLPLGIVMSDALVDELGTRSTGLLQASGTDVPVRYVTLDGSGLKSLPLGLVDVRLVTFDGTDAAFDGTGLASLPLGVRAIDAHGGGTDLLKLSNVKGVNTATAIGLKLAEGGWATEGYGAASILGTSTKLAIAPSFVAELDGLGAGAVALPSELEPAEEPPTTVEAPVTDTGF